MPRWRLRNPSGPQPIPRAEFSPLRIEISENLLLSYCDFGDTTGTQIDHVPA
jgi:hypothetical protein